MILKSYHTSLTELLLLLLEFVGHDMLYTAIETEVKNWTIKNETINPLFRIE